MPKVNALLWWQLCFRTALIIYLVLRSCSLAFFNWSSFERAEGSKQAHYVLGTPQREAVPRTHA